MMMTSKSAAWPAFWLGVCIYNLVGVAVGRLSAWLLVPGLVGGAACAVVWLRRSRAYQRWRMRRPR
jgi:hypothetical protein